MDRRDLGLAPRKLTPLLFDKQSFLEVHLLKRSLQNGSALQHGNLGANVVLGRLTISFRSSRAHVAHVEEVFVEAFYLDQGSGSIDGGLCPGKQESKQSAQQCKKEESTLAPVEYPPIFE